MFAMSSSTNSQKMPTTSNYNTANNTKITFFAATRSKKISH